MPQEEAAQATFAHNYAQMSDAELLQLQSELGSLVEPAIVALQQEIARRRLKERLNDVNDDEERNPNGYVLSPDAGPSHLSYGWGKFIGSTTVLSGVLGAIFCAIQKDAYGVVATILYAMYGIGIYRKKKWAIFFMEVGSAVGLLVVVIVFIRDKNLESLGSLVVLIVFWIPQTIYFWKRRDELT